MRRLLVMAFAVLLLSTVPAHAADTYTVDTCATASGGAATVDGWHVVSQTATSVAVSCPGPGIVASRAANPTNGSARAEIMFTPPAGTRMTGLRLWRSFGLTEGWGYGIDVGERRENCDSTCPPGSPINSSPDLGLAGADLGPAVLFVQCAAGACPTTSGPLLTIRRLQVDIADDSDPTFSSAPSGDLLDTTRPLSGVRTVFFGAADTGGGVYLAHLEVDGQRVASQTVDANGGRCAKPFTSFAPCRGSAAGSISLDTAKLPDGPHAVRLVVTDATETNTVAYGPVQVTTSNQSSTCETATSPAITARFVSTSKPTYTRRGGAAFSLTGAAPAGSGLTLLALETRTGAGWVVAGSGVAGADGSYRLQVPAGPSRSLRVAFRASALAGQLSCSNVVQVRVPARVTLSAKRSSKRRYRISGRLLGGFVPARGKLVELQAYERGKWRGFGSARSTASGRYAYTYKFRSESIGRRFRLRARVRADAAYPFSLGYSKVVRVRVR